jgi:flagellar hook-basal body complex protein FliE
MININAINSVSSTIRPDSIGAAQAKPSGAGSSGFADTIKAAGEQISKVDNLQQVSDISIQDLLTGKNEDITTMVSAVAKADMSFKLLVGVSNKLIDAYKQTMNMPI